MKNYFFGLVISATVFGACHSNPNNNVATTAVDTTNRTMLDRPQPVDMSGVSDTIIGSDGATYVRVRPNQPTQAQGLVSAPAATAPVRRSTATRSTRSSRSYSSSGGSRSGSYSGGSGSTATTTAPRKKGWSSAAKGTAIGAATGAVAGAIIDKKHGRGAIIGGVVGAAGGYIIGRNKDKKASQGY